MEWRSRDGHRQTGIAHAGALARAILSPGEWPESGVARAQTPACWTYGARMPASPVSGGRIGPPTGVKVAGAAGAGNAHDRAIVSSTAFAAAVVASRETSPQVTADSVRRAFPWT